MSEHPTKPAPTAVPAPVPVVPKVSVGLPLTTYSLVASGMPVSVILSLVTQGAEAFKAQPQFVTSPI